VSAKAYGEAANNAHPKQHAIAAKTSPRRRRRSIASSASLEELDGVLVEAAPDGEVNLSSGPFEPQSALLTVVHTSNLTQQRCTYNAKHFHRLKRKVHCDSSCPFSLFLPDDPCHKVCVKANGCGKMHPTRSFADKKTKECVATCGVKQRHRIVGCKACARTGICKKCVPGFTVSKDGKHCTDDYQAFWFSVYGIIGGSVFLLVIYMYNLSQRPTINDEVLEHALMHRDHRKVWQERDDQAFHQFDFSNTDVLSTDISGQGVLLYFGFVMFCCCLAGVLLVGAFVAYEFSSLKVHRDVFKDDKDGVAQQCSAKTEHLAETSLEAYDHYNIRMFICMASTYVVVLIGSMLFVWYQTNLSYRWDEENSTHEDYACRADGLPEDATDPVELRDFFQESLDAELRKRNYTNEPLHVVGVSIAYDYKEHQDIIENSVKDWVEDLEVQKERRNWIGRPVRESSLNVITDADGNRTDADGNRRNCGRSLASVLKLEFLDYFFWGSCKEQPERQHHEEQLVRSKQIKSILEGLPSSGCTYIIVSQPVVVDILLEIFNGPDAPRFRNSTAFKITEVLSEPPSLYWENFTEMNFWPRIVFGGFVVLMTIILWLCFYLVYALSYSSYVSIPGAKPSFFQDTLLGLLVAVGNAIVAQVVDSVTQWSGFRQKDRRDIAILSMAFLATLLNTACDLWMVMQIAQGVQLTNDFQGKNEGYDHVIAEELFSLIVPGYLILPYIATPIIEHVLPYIMGQWYIRSRKTSLRDAEACIACPEFDICWRYSDIMNNFTICSLMLTFVTPYSYRVMCWLVIFLIMILAIDKYKLLRQTSQTFYTTRRLDDAAQLWWSFPTGILATITVWWACKAELLPWMKGQHKFLCALGFCVHVALYLVLWTIARGLVPEAKTETMQYKTMCEKLWEEGKVWSYFNTNPVFCLRSKYLDVKEPGAIIYPCIPYVPGKVFLQQGVPLRFAHGEETLLKAMKSPFGLINLGSRRINLHSTTPESSCTESSGKETKNPKR
jgi:hypothetical protein